MARVLAALVSVILVLAATPASSAVKAPPRVSAPWVSASSTSSITLSWPAAKGATRYRVTYGTSLAAVAKSSAKARWTSGRQTSLRVTGLARGRMHCFMVAAVKGTKRGPRSARHCKPTMRRANDTSRPTTSIMTFNVCLKSSTCSTPPARLDAIIQRVRSADADVLMFQEYGDGYDVLEPRLKKLGYDRSLGFHRYHAVYHRRDVWKLSLYEEETCTPEGECFTSSAPLKGYGWLGRNGGNGRAVVVGLEHRATGQRFRFYSVHLSAGDTARARAFRRGETSRLVRLIQHGERYGPADQVVVAGDTNSFRARADDYPRVALAKLGLYDAYERSATYAFPFRDSYTANKVKPRRGITFGNHVDRIFLPDPIGSTAWRVVVRTRNGRYVTPMASDHNPVRATLYLP